MRLMILTSLFLLSIAASTCFSAKQRSRSTIYSHGGVLTGVPEKIARITWLRLSFRESGGDTVIVSADYLVESNDSLPNVDFSFIAPASQASNFTEEPLMLKFNCGINSRVVPHHTSIYKGKKVLWGRFESVKIFSYSFSGKLKKGKNYIQCSYATRHALLEPCGEFVEFIASNGINCRSTTIDTVSIMYFPRGKSAIHLPKQLWKIDKKAVPVKWVLKGKGTLVELAKDGITQNSMLAWIEAGFVQATAYNVQFSEDVNLFNPTSRDLFRWIVEGTGDKARSTERLAAYPAGTLEWLKKGITEYYKGSGVKSMEVYYTDVIDKLIGEKKTPVSK